MIIAPNSILCGDCLEVLKDVPDNTFDSFVTDPPYGLKFMGKDWDHGVPSVRFWQEFFRVAKPGAHLLAFGGTRTHHRLMVAIEDAGWEIRDTLGWIYGQGFPKGKDVAWVMHQKACIACGCMVKYDHQDNREETGFIPEAKYNLRFVRASYLQTPVHACSKCGQVLQPFMPEQNTQEHRKAWSQSEVIWPEQPRMERRSDVETSQRELQRCPICKMSHGILADGAKGWVCDDTQTGDGAIPWQVANEDGGRPSYRPQSLEQLNNQFNAFSIERTAQTYRGFDLALKPAWEPIILARKPLDGTVANNVLKWGCGGINVDRCRVAINSDVDDKRLGGNGTWSSDKMEKNVYEGGYAGDRVGSSPLGRFPANLIHDGSDEVLELFPESKCGAFNGHRNHPKSNNTYNHFALQDEVGHPASSGSAARFFYCAKASKSERGEGNTHPTVKPLALMQYLCRLITPPNGLICDPLCGSGSTLIAAAKEGFNYIGIDKDQSSVDIANNRILKEATK